MSLGDLIESAESPNVSDALLGSMVRSGYMTIVREAAADLAALREQLVGKDATIAALRERVADLEGVMGKLPVTADGVPVVPGRDRVYCIFADKPRSSSLVWGDEDGWRTSNYWKPLSEVYSTPQAAQAAAEQQP